MTAVAITSRKLPLAGSQGECGRYRAQCLGDTDLWLLDIFYRLGESALWGASLSACNSWDERRLCTRLLRTRTVALALRVRHGSLLLRQLLSRHIEFRCTQNALLEPDASPLPFSQHPYMPSRPRGSGDFPALPDALHFPAPLARPPLTLYHASPTPMSGQPGLATTAIAELITAVRDVRLTQLVSCECFLPWS